MTERRPAARRWAPAWRGEGLSRAPQAAPAHPTRGKRGEGRGRARGEGKGRTATILMGSSDERLLVSEAPARKEAEEVIKGSMAEIAEGRSRVYVVIKAMNGADEA